VTGTVCGRPLAVIEAPSNLGLKPPARGREPGTRRMPEALAAAGLYDLLAPSSVRRIEPPPYREDDGNPLGIRNAADIAAYAERLAAAVSRTVSGGGFPLVIGGDCSILVGSMLGLRRTGRYGLLFVDGHTDFYLPEQSSTGGAAGMDLALVAGWGPDLLTDIGGLRPYVPVERIVLLGNRDEEPRPPAPIPHARDAGMRYRDLAALRRTGVEETVRRDLADLLAEHALDGFWIHVDVDVLDSTVMPAVDSPQPDGLSFGELATALRTALSTGAAAGLQVTIFDPDLDPDGTAARRLAHALADAFGRRPEGRIPENTGGDDR
jgi:arginase